MCTFVTLIAATDRTTALQAVLDRYAGRMRPHRQVEALHNPSVAACLQPHERPFILSPGAGCDCRTVLGSALRRPDPEVELAKARTRYRRKGWGAARIERALASKAQALARPPRACHDQAWRESADEWQTMLEALASDLRLRRIGLMHHHYVRSVSRDGYVVSRVKAGPLSEASQRLPLMADGVIHDFTHG